MAEQLFYFRLKVSEPGRLKRFHVWHPIKKKKIATFIVGEHYAEFLTKNKEIADDLKSLGYIESPYSEAAEVGMQAAEPLKPVANKNKSNAAEENGLETLIYPPEALASMNSALSPDEEDSIFNS